MCGRYTGAVHQSHKPRAMVGWYIIQSLAYSTSCAWKNMYQVTSQTLHKLPFYADGNYPQERTSHMSQSQVPLPCPNSQEFPLHMRGGRASAFLLMGDWGCNPTRGLSSGYDLSQVCSTNAVFCCLCSALLDLTLPASCLYNPPVGIRSKQNIKEKCVRNRIWQYNKAGCLAVQLTPLLYLE